MNILFSIITVSLNSSKHISNTIESVLNQTYTNYEYIIIDGKSTDGTVDIIRDYEDEFKGKLKWISEKDSGIYDAMNKGIKLAEGKLIGILNSDDWYKRDTLEVVANCYKNNLNESIKYGVYYGGINLIENGESIRKYFSDHNNMPKNGMIPHVATFVKKSVYNKHGMYKLKYNYSADYELILRFLNRGVKFRKINKVLTNFRMGGMWQQTLLSNIETIKINYQYNYINFKKYFIKSLKLYLKHFLNKIRKK